MGGDGGREGRRGGERRRGGEERISLVQTFLNKKKSRTIQSRKIFSFKKPQTHEILGACYNMTG
jgi:hypothetical protein